MAVFKDNFFYIKYLFNYALRNVTTVTPFQDLSFWQCKDDESTLLIVNNEDLITAAVRIFKIKILPENVEASMNQFLKALNRAHMSYTYQVVQMPIIGTGKSSSRENDLLSQKEKNSKLSSTSFRTFIYFSIFYDVRGILTATRFKKLKETIEIYSQDLKSNFYANFPHTKIISLSGVNLINAIRTFYLGKDVEDKRKTSDIIKPKEKVPSLLLKFACYLYLAISTSFILINLEVSFFYLIIIELSVLLSTLLLWWRDLLFYFTERYLFYNEKVVLLDPFSEVKFLHVKKYNDTIFMRVDNDLLVGMNAFNLKYASHPTFSYPYKFFRALNGHKISFSYTIQCTPASYYLFHEECFDLLNLQTKTYLSKEMNTAKDQYDWLDMRSGIWRTILTISIYSYRNTNSIKSNNEIESLQLDLASKSEIVKNAFETNFSNLSLQKLIKQKLISGFLFECLKTKLFRLIGTHLSYLFFQGKTLIDLVGIVNEFKKGLETKIAAEFNTPLQLENFIAIGHAINTEFLEEEVPLGFTLDQAKNLLITNGLPKDREALCVKIVLELIKVNIPSIVFDFTGNWSKLIRYFQNSQLENKILIFKLGTSFNVDLLSSGISGDMDNMDYLNYFFDAYALAFKANSKSIEVLKETIFSKPELDTSSIELDLEFKQKWEKSPQAESILALFKDFNQQNVVFSDKSQEHGGNVNAIDFLKGDKTILIDLSVLKDLEKKVFVAFVLISKFVHYLKNFNEFSEKTIVIPHVDLFFDNYFIDNQNNNMNYGTINTFLDPLLQQGFGLIFTANQARYLHPNFLNQVKNIVAFKATDPRDIAVLKNQMNLQELQGTGYYSSKRNNTYQIDFLMNLQSDEVIVKRSDIYQPFPGKIDIQELEEIAVLNREEVFNHMKKQGYNIVDIEKKLLDQAKKTSFEKDLGMYSEFREEIVNFLKAIQQIDRVGNLYKNLIKKQLLEYISPKASKRAKDKFQLKEIRDEVFQTLLDREYLIESHPKRASGSESISTSYAVGPKFQIALDDHANTKRNSLDNISIETIEQETDKNLNYHESDSEESQLKVEKESGFNTKYSEEPPIKIEEESNFYAVDSEKSHLKAKKEDGLTKALLHESGTLLYDTYRMSKLLDQKSYEKVLELGENSLREFLGNQRKKFVENNKDNPDMANNLDAFFNALANTTHFPFTKQQVSNYISQCVSLNKSKSDIETNAKKMYDLISKFLREILNQSEKIS